MEKPHPHKQHEILLETLSRALAPVLERYVRTSLLEKMSHDRRVKIQFWLSIGISALYSVTAVVFLVITWFIEDIQTVTIILAGIVHLAATLPLLVSSPRSSGHSLAFLSFWSMTAISINSGGFQSPGFMLWLSTPVLVALVLIGQRAAKMWMLIVFGEYVLWGILKLNNIVLPTTHASAYVDVVNISCVLGFVLLILGIIFLYDALFRQHLDEITSINQHLERLIAERTEKLAAALDEVSEVNLFKSAFVAQASHEFRTPLTIIQLAVETLEHFEQSLDTDIQDEKQARYDIIYQEIEKMVLLLNDLLRIETITREQLHEFQHKIIGDNRWRNDKQSPIMHTPSY